MSRQVTGNSDVLSTSMTRKKQTRKVPNSSILASLRMHDGSHARFGAVRFSGSKYAPSKWAAVSVHSKVGDAYQMIQDAWNLTRPPVIISVTGSALDTNLKPKDMVIFRRGLRNAARATNAWIVTGGTNQGVMKLVGSMVHDSDDSRRTNDIVCIGIVPFGCVYKHEAMRVAPKGKVFAYEDLDPDKPAREAGRFGKASIPTSKDRAALNPNHTHFLMVDDGKDGAWGGEIDFRTALENHICTYHDAKAALSDTDDTLPTPMVLIVVGGGIGTLNTIIGTLEKERPVVVLAGASPSRASRALPCTHTHAAGSTDQYAWARTRTRASAPLRARMSVRRPVVDVGALTTLA